MPQRYGHSSCTIGDNVYVISGASDSKDAKEDMAVVYRYNRRRAVWDQPATSGNIPASLTFACCVVSPSKPDCIILLGGANNAKVVASCLYVLNTSTFEWIQPSSAAGTPNAMALAAAATGDSVYAFGGFGISSDSQSQPKAGKAKNEYLRDIWELDSSLQWHRLNTTGDIPTARLGHSMVATSAGELIVFGGSNGSKSKYARVTRPACN